MSPTRQPPPSRRIAEALRDAIQAGTYAAGDRLPSERELASQHGTARNTAREAISILQSEGLVDAEHGRGVFVRGPARLLRLGAERYSGKTRRETGLSPFRAEAHRQGKTAHVVVPSITKVQAPPDVAQRLQPDDADPIDPTEPLMVVERVNHYFADDEPVQIGRTYIPWTLVEGTVLADQADTGPGSIYARLEELGHTIHATREEVTARMPTPQERRDLAVPAGVPIVEVLHTGLNQNGHPFEVTRFVMRADLTALDYTMPVPEP